MFRNRLEIWYDSTSLESVLIRHSFIVQVITHHEDLLTQASNANSLSGTLSSVRSGLNDLDASVDKYALRIVVLIASLKPP